MTNTTDQAEHSKVDGAEDDLERNASEAASAHRLDIPEARPGGAPDWAILPPGFAAPRGKQIFFLRFRASLTDTPWKGERQCVVWAINSADKRAALDRSRRDPNRASDELSKQMIRVHDGKATDWTGDLPGGIEDFWNEIGEKCRGLLTRLYMRLHVVSVEENTDFLENCIEARSVVT